MSKDENSILVLVGPTAVGKTKMAIELVETFNQLEVISADSRQIFRFMDIGTAKPTKEEIDLIPHHFINIKNPDETYNAGEFGSQGRKKYFELIQKNNIPIVVGGSGLYIQSLIYGLFEGEVNEPDVKQELQIRADQEGLTNLYNELKSVDPVSAEKIHFNDRQRIVRALEVWNISGKPISELRRDLHPKINLNPIFIGLNRDREKLYQMINKRVDLMINEGIIDEVRKLRQKGFNKNLQSQKTVGYQELHDYLDEKCSKDEAIELIKRNTRRFAKRQLTWFNKNKSIQWFDIVRPKQWNEAKKNIKELMK